MHKVMFLSAAILGMSLMGSPLAMAQESRAAIGDWPVETDVDSMYNFMRSACFAHPQQADCVGFEKYQAPMGTVAPVHVRHGHPGMMHHG